MINVIVAFLLGLWTMWVILRQYRPLVEVTRIDGQISVVSGAADLSPQVREEIITALFDEVDRIEKDTKYDIS